VVLVLVVDEHSRNRIKFVQVCTAVQIQYSSTAVLVQYTLNESNESNQWIRMMNDSNRIESISHNKADGINQPQQSRSATTKPTKKEQGLPHTRVRVFPRHSEQGVLHTRVRVRVFPRHRLVVPRQQPSNKKAQYPKPTGGCMA
jgi:hypothetical protein